MGNQCLFWEELDTSNNTPLYLIDKSVSNLNLYLYKGDFLWQIPSKVVYW